MIAAEWLEGCRERWDWPTGKLAQMQARLTRHRDFNTDCAGDAIPPDQIAAYRLLLESGRVVWGVVPPGDDLLSEPGTDDRTANVVYGATPFFDRRLDVLQHVAERIFLLQRGETAAVGADDALLRIAALLHAEKEPIQESLPLSLTGGHSGVYLSTVVIHRRRFPTRRLTVRAFPLIICPEKTPRVMPLPLRYWSPGLVSSWAEEAAGKVAGLRTDYAAFVGETEAGEETSPPLALAAPTVADVRSQYLDAPLRVTPDAAAQFLRRLKRERLSAQEAVMVAAVQESGDHQAIAYRVTVARNSRIESDDIVTEVGYGGLRVLAPANALRHLTGKVIDFRADRDGGFVFRNPGEAA